MARGKPPLLAITPGDPDGIGPEITWKTLKSGFAEDSAQLLCIGAAEPFRKLGAPVRQLSLDEIVSGVWLRSSHPKAKKVVNIISPPPAPASRFRQGFEAGWSIELATRLVQSGVAQALVTGPIHKERLQRGGYRFPGHTEMLAHLCRVPEVTMMLANEQLRISLVTTHLSLKQVPRAITAARVRLAVRHTVEALRGRWGISRPKVGIAALNPHAGEAGLFGNEEIKVIGPTIQRLKTEYGERCHLHGPLPADTLFANHLLAPARNRFDAVVCMYHDQGLIPVKLLDFPRTVNITLGLPIVRTSVDHGVGFDIAGKGVANPSSLQSAISLAIRLSSRK